MKARNDVQDIEAILADNSAKYYDDPLGWVMWAFDWGYGDLKGFDGPDEWQKKWLVNLGKSIKSRNFDGVKAVKAVRKAVASGHGIGKSALTSWIILFIMSTRPMSKGVVTANTGDQLRTKTWSELAKWKNRCITGHWFTLNSGKGSLALVHNTWPEEWRVDAQTCREENSEAFAGLHSASSTPFYLFDEASAVPDKIWEVAEGGLTDGEPFFFVFGNPTRNTGAFRRCFKGDRWDTAQVDSRTAKMTNKDQIDEWKKDWGEDSDFFRVRVKGMFPKAADDQFIPVDIVEEARKRRARYLGDDPLICGIDVARGGADNVMIQFRRGKDAKTEKVYKIPGEKVRNSMKLVDKLTLILNRHKPDVSFLDATGIGGPIGDRLRQLGFHVVDVHFGENAADEKRFKMRTAEMGYRCRQWLLEGGAIPDSNTLEEELTDRMYGHNDRGQLVLETKKQVKERLGHSPDWSDALYLTFAQEVPKKVEPRGIDDLPGFNETLNTDYDPLELM